MRSLAAVALSVGLAMPVAAADIASMLIPSPLTMLLTVGQWITKDRVEVFYVQVQANGRDEQDARTQAFRLAVNQAVGSLLLSQTQVVNGDVKRNEIINYSSGHIQDFTILDRSRDGSGMTIRMEVWVKRSSIADRLLSESRSVGQVEGGRITEQIRSFQNERRGADSVVDAVLADFPQRAFDVTLGKTGVAMDDNRRPILKIPFRIAWNEKYVKSFSEAIMTVNQYPQCGGWFDQCVNSGLKRINGGYFSDEIIYKKVFDVMWRSWVRVRIMGLDGQTKFSQCTEVPELGADWSRWKFVDAGGGVVQTNLGRWKDYVYALDIGTLPTDQLDRVEISVIRAGSC